MSWIKQIGGIAALFGAVTFSGCLAPGQLVGSDGVDVRTGSGDGSQPTKAGPAPIGAVCAGIEERIESFPGFSANEITIDDHAAQCESGVCVQNHFQGRVSCPYGQAKGEGACSVAGGDAAVTVPVLPQLVERQAAAASICSCQCAGDGPGPFCTCPEQMQCEHLIDNLGLGDTHLAGSYCIPKGTQYAPSENASVCVEPGCGARHPQ